MVAFSVGRQTSRTLIVVIVVERACPMEWSASEGKILASLNRAEARKGRDRDRSVAPKGWADVQEGIGMWWEGFL